MSNVILCLTHSADFYTIDRVMESLAQKGYQPLRFNCDSFPFDTQLSSCISHSGTEYSIQCQQKTYSNRDICAVWFRKNSLPNIQLSAPEAAQHPLQSQCVRESEAAKALFFNSLSHVPWIDPINTILQGEDKGRQLRHAVRAGLMIPDTLITNCPQKVRAFFHQHQGKVVVKMLTPLTTSMGKPSAFVYTSRLSEQQLNDLDGLKHAPMVFQNEIDKAFELRVAYVNGRCFTGKICTQQASENAQVDWRQAAVDECEWQHFELTESVAQAINTLMISLGLSFGAIDLIVTPTGQTVFLEVNPCGEWGMLQKFLHLPIAQHIAQSLIEKIKKPAREEIEQCQSM